MTYVPSTQLGDGTWKGGTHQLILHWCDQIHQLDELSGERCHFSKMIILQNAVHLIPDLHHQIQEIAAVQMEQGAKDVDFEAYFKLVKAAAISYDAQFSPKKLHAHPPASHQTVYTHDLTKSGHDVVVFPDNTYYDIDIGRT